MQHWCSGNTLAFQANIIGSNPICCSICGVGSPASAIVTVTHNYKGENFVRFVGVTYCLLAHGVVVTQQTLTLLSQVRILVGQPFKAHRRRELRAESSRWVNKRVKLLQHSWRAKIRQFDAGRKGLRSRSALDDKLFCDTVGRLEVSHL